MKPFRFIAPMAAAATLTSASGTTAQITGVDVFSVPQDVVPGFVVNDILLSFDGQLTGVQLLVQLTSGTIYQDSFGADTAPNPAFFGLVPSLQYDSFITLGAFNSADADAVPGIAGGAVGIGGANAYTFDDSLIDIAYFPPGGTVIADETLYPVATITLSDDANGTMTVYGSAGGQLGPVTTRPFVDGSFLAPPPPRGDYNRDYRVDQGDLDLVLQNWGADTATRLSWGWTGWQPDDRVTQNELDGVLQNWGALYTPAFDGAAVPEPALGAGLLTVLCAGRRRLARG